MGHEYRRKRIVEEKLKKLSDDINLVEEMPAQDNKKKFKAIEWLKILKKIGYGLLGD